MSFGESKGWDASMGNEHVYVVGTLLGGVESKFTFGEHEITDLGEFELAHFIACYDFNGNGVWVKVFLGWAYDVHSVSAEDGSLYITASSIGPPTGTMDLSQEEGLFVAKFDSLGQLLWSKTAITGVRNDGNFASGIAVNASGDVFIAGCVGSTIDFDGNYVDASPFSGSAGFLAKIAVDPPPPDLTINHKASRFEITYPAAFEEAILETTTDLSPGNWEPTGAIGLTVEGEVIVSLPMKGRERFFRLRSK